MLACVALTVRAYIVCFFHCCVPDMCCTAGVPDWHDCITPDPHDVLQILACSEGPLLSQAQDKLLSIAKDWRLTSFLPCLLGGPQHAHFYEIEEGG